RALAWGSTSLRETIARPLVIALVVLAALEAGSALRAEPRDPLRRVLAVFPWAMLVIVVFDALVVEAIGLRWLPADRLADSAWLPVVLAPRPAPGPPLRPPPPAPA